MTAPNDDRVYPLSINGQIFTLNQPKISGAQIRALGGLSDQDMVVWEEPGHGADRLIADDQQVLLIAGKLVRFYTHPPTMFG